MNTKSKLFVAIVFVLSVTWFYFTPHLAVGGMKSAIESKDEVKLSAYVNFPALRESVKAGFSAKLAQQPIKEIEENSFGGLGAALANAFINPLVDVIVTPENLAMMLKGYQPKPVKTSAQPDSAQAGIDTAMSYESFDRFVVTIKNKGATDGSVDLVFNRNGLFSWQLSALRLPF